MILLLSVALAAAPPEVLRRETFEVARPSEVVATVTAGCAGCSWGEKGREAAALALTLDGRYSQHLFLSRGERPADYRVALGAVDPGTHRVLVTEVTDLFGNTTMIRFEKLRDNAGVDPALFVFGPLKGVDVIDMTAPPMRGR